MTERDRFAEIARRFNDAGARFVVIGVWGANYYASSGATLFRTLDRDLFLPMDPVNLLLIWQGCEDAGLKLTSGTEPLDSPRDSFLAEAVVQRRALTQASDGVGLDIDLSLVMAGFDFETAWISRRTFDVDGVEIPVARLEHIVESKSRAGRPKDALFLETHKEALRQMLGMDDSEPER